MTVIKSETFDAIHPNNLRLLKDIVIPVGTIFTERKGTTHWVKDNFDTVIGLTKDTSGVFCYGVDPMDPDIREWFEDVL